MHGPSRFLACLAVVALGCGSDSAAERLDLGLGDGGGALLVDTRCEATCAGEDTLSVRVDYADRQYVDDELVELLQYRVDYDLPSVPGDLPYFAGKLQMSLAPGGGASVSLVVAGTAQREFVREHVDETVAGTATLTLAGYDWDNKQVSIEGEFDIRFADVSPFGGLVGEAGSGGDGDAALP